MAADLNAAKADDAKDKAKTTCCAKKTADAKCCDAHKENCCKAKDVKKECCKKDPKAYAACDKAKAKKAKDKKK